MSILNGEGYGTLLGNPYSYDYMNTLYGTPMAPNFQFETPTYETPSLGGWTPDLTGGFNIANFEQYLPETYNYGGGIGTPTTWMPSPSEYPQQSFDLGAINAATDLLGRFTNSYKIGMPSAGITPPSFKTSPLDTGSIQAKPTFWGNILQGAKDILTSREARPALLSALGFLIPQPKYNVPSGQELLAKNQKVMDTAARAKLNEYINNPQNIGGQATQNYINAINADWDLTEAKALADFDANWNARYGEQRGSDYDKAKADLQTKLTTARNLQVAQQRTTLLQDQISKQIALISQAYGLDQQMLTDLMTMDANQASIKYGIRLETVNQFRKMLYNMAISQAYANAQGENMEKVGGLIKSGKYPGNIPEDMLDI